MKNNYNNNIKCPNFFYTCILLLFLRVLLQCKPVESGL